MKTRYVSPLCFAQPVYQTQGSLFALRVPGRERVVAEAVTITNATVATVDEQFGMFALGGATPRANRVCLIEPRGIIARPLRGRRALNW
jgi:hypothetical protein